MNRFLTFFLALVLIFTAGAIPVCAAPSFFCDFENMADADKWEGGIFDDTDAASGSMCFAVNDPIGDSIGGRVTHIFSYLQGVKLEAGAIYRISMSAKNPDFDPASPQRAGIRQGDETGRIIFEFSGIPERWTTINQCFMVQESNYYSFSVELNDGDADAGFMVDDLTIEKIDINPESLTILGDTTLTIPYMGSTSATYRLGAYSQDGETINILSDVSVMEALDLPAGVSFDSQTNTVTVTEYCPNNSSFTLECTAPDFLSLSPITAEISLTRNIFRNSDFAYGSERWLYEPMGEVYYGSTENYLTLYTEIEDDYGYRATLWPDTQALLLEDVMYVLRARVRIDGEYEPSIYSGNSSDCEDWVVNFNLMNMPIGEWVEVICAYTPEVSGIYNLAANFYTSSKSVVDISEITLSPEQPEQTYITLHAPGNISVPDTSTTFPFNAYVRDQAGQITEGDCILSLSPNIGGLRISNGGIVVSPDAVEGEYEIYAEAEDEPTINARLTFTVSHSNVGDGGFEEKRVNEWWAAARPAEMTIIDDGNKFARIRSSDEFAIVLNNSYMKLYANQPYAFSAKVLDGFDNTVTAFIETVGGERVPIIQSAADSGEVFSLFQTEDELVGRLMLYISSESGRVRMELDDVELFRAIVSVSPPTVSGVADVGETVDVSFDFFNNLDPSSNPSDCTVSWFIINDDGEDEYIGSGAPFVIPENARGRYIFCEVTPICKRTGLSGAPMRSIPVITGGDAEFIPPLIDEETLPNVGSRPALPTLTPIILSRPGDFVFDDVDDHWAAYEIMSLYQSGIVTGVSETSFDPSGQLTRAELAAMLCRAFSASGGNQNFYDVAIDSWYREYIAPMSVLGIMNGVSDTLFAPDEPVTREQLAATMARIYTALELPERRRTITWFYDYKEISSWAKDGVEISLGLGILNGTPSSTLMPKRNASRAEACVMLARLMEVIKGSENSDE